jgi:hypothetical protein
MWNSKPKKTGHNCRRRMFGNPKVGDGVCWWSKWRPAVEERINSKRMAQAILDAINAGWDPDDVE